eukprot:TRINITY_DN7470_c0_g1_i1.p1 TRINITY_DN7470_c0_g1~~TRINITY_DN7470_c0_g1_i1.p1  ORF type:complete len:243 (+),score=57.85 TRINITY_DN7470_c0_g1_i1:124-852(+)
MKQSESESDTESQTDDSKEDSEEEREIEVDFMIPAFTLKIQRDDDDREEIIEESKNKLGLGSAKVKVMRIIDSRDKKKRPISNRLAIQIPKSKFTLEYIENICSENKHLKDKLEKASEALITFHNKILKDQQSFEELEKKYNEEKKTRLLLESALEHTSSRRKSIGFSPPVSPVGDGTEANTLGTSTRSRAKTGSLEISKDKDDKLSMRGSCRFFSCKGFKSIVNFSWLCNFGHINLKHNMI